MLEHPYKIYLHTQLLLRSHAHIMMHQAVTNDFIFAFCNRPSNMPSIYESDAIIISDSDEEQEAMD